MTELIDPLAGELRALRTLQCPDQIVPNDDRTAYRPSSGAFIPGSDGTTSIDLEESLIRAGLPLLTRYPSLPRSNGLVAHAVNVYLEKQFIVAHAPIDDNPHHGEVRTEIRNNRLRRAARALAEQAEVLIPIDNDLAERLGAPPLVAFYPYPPSMTGDH